MTLNVFHVAQPFVFLFEELFIMCLRLFSPQVFKDPIWKNLLCNSLACLAFTTYFLVFCHKNWKTKSIHVLHGILRAKILEWVAFPFSGGSSQLRDWTQVSRTAGGFFTSWAPREALLPEYTSAVWFPPSLESLSQNFIKVHVNTTVQ